MISQAQFYQKYKGKYIKIGGGTVSSVDWDGTNGFGGQCATLGREYISQCYGYGNRSYGHGYNYVDIPKGKILSKPENWCLIVWPIQSGLPYGHVAIYYKGKMISQNPNTVALMTIWSGKKYYVRPYQYNSVEQTSYTTGGIKLREILKSSGKITVPADRYVYGTRPVKSKKPTKPTKVSKGTYDYNGLYDHKTYGFVDSQGRACDYVRCLNEKTNAYDVWMPIYKSDTVYELVFKKK